MGILARSICGVLMRDEQDASDGKKRRVGKPADAVRQDVDYDRGTNHHDARVCRPIKICSEQKSV